MSIVAFQTILMTSLATGLAMVPLVVLYELSISLVKRMEASRERAILTRIQEELPAESLVHLGSMRGVGVEAGQPVSPVATLELSE